MQAILPVAVGGAMHARGCMMCHGLHVHGCKRSDMAYEMQTWTMSAALQIMQSFSEQYAICICQLGGQVHVQICHLGSV